MDKATGRMTVFFEEPFWVGVFERMEDSGLSAVKVTFGAEPKDYEIYKFILGHYYELKFSPVVAAVIKETKKNPKRMQRQVKKQLENVGVGTKSQQALKLQQELAKTEHKSRSREKKMDEEERRFDKKQQKKREKHRGH